MVASASEPVLWVAGAHVLWLSVPRPQTFSWFLVVDPQGGVATHARVSGGSNVADVVGPEFALGSCAGCRLSRAFLAVGRRGRTRRCAGRAAQGQAIAAACDAKITFTGGTPTPNCFSYDTSADAFQFNLSTPKTLTGNQTITATIKKGTAVLNASSVSITIKR